MPHRDDEEALRAKLDESERELADAQKKLGEIERENARLRRGAPAPTPPRPVGGGPKPGVFVLAASVGLLVVGLGAGFFFLARRPAPAYYPPPGRAVPPVPPPPGPPIRPMPPPAAPLVVHVPARATAVSGETPVRVDDACTITATIVPGPAIELSDATIECGTTRLYGLRDEVFGVSMTELQAVAWSGDAPGTIRYEIVLSDTGTRSGRPEAIVRSWTGEGSVFQTGVGAFRVDLEVDPMSEAIPEPMGSLVHHDPGLPGHVLRHGHVVHAAAGLPEGASCRIVVRPSPGNPALNTRTHVRCGTTSLYGIGTAGLALRIGDVITDSQTTPQDGDPAMALDLDAGTLTIRDDRGGVTDTVEIALDPAPGSLAPAAGS